MKKLLIIMLGVFIFTPISLKADTYDSNDEPISDLRFYTLNEVFNKVERPLSNYIINQDPNFDILNYTNFIGLNGHSLREVFENTSLLEANQLVVNGDFSDETTGWRFSSGVVAWLTGGYLQNTADGTANVSYINGTVYNLTDKYYSIIKARVTNDLAINIQLRHGGTVVTSQATPTINIWYNLSGVFIPTNAEIRVYQVYTNTTDATNAVMEVDYAYAFNISTLIANKQYSPLFNTTFDLMSDTDIKTQMDEFVAKPYLFINYTDLGIDTLTTTQMDYWFSVYQNPNLLNGLEIMDDNELFFYNDTIFDISKMKIDKIFSPVLSTFDSLTENQMLSQFEQWEYRDFNKVKVISYNDYLFFNPDGTLQSMLSYYDNYNLNLKNVEASINEIDKNEIIILLIALIAYIIGVIISIYFRNNVLFAGSSLLWFIPVFMIPNMFIITFSIIMIIMSFVITFYNNKEEGLD